MIYNHCGQVSLIGMKHLNPWKISKIHKCQPGINYVFLFMRSKQVLAITQAAVEIVKPRCRLLLGFFYWGEYKSLPMSGGCWFYLCTAHQNKSPHVLNRLLDFWFKNRSMHITPQPVALYLYIFISSSAIHVQLMLLCPQLWSSNLSPRNNICLCEYSPLFQDQLLFCDDCDRGYHMYCLSPPMSEPPEGT